MAARKRVRPALTALEEFERDDPAMKALRVAESVTDTRSTETSLQMTSRNTSVASPSANRADGVSALADNRNVTGSAPLTADQEAKDAAPILEPPLAGITLGNHSGWFMCFVALFQWSSRNNK